MGVSMDFKSRYRWLRSQKPPSLLGGGLLERVRSTTLALLGVTTAVGLAMVALALNQSWPLLADSPIPVGPPRHEAVGEATIAAQAFARATGVGLVRLDGSAASASGRAGNGGDNGGARGPEGDFAPSASAELVVAPSAPVEAHGDAPRGGGDPASPPSPTGKPPREPENTVPASAPAPPEPAPQPPPTVETTPAASSAEVPVNSSNDEGDDDDWDDDDGDWDDDDDDWHGRDHGYGHGHRWSRGHDDD
jgi:hypothetical protein